MGCVVSIIPLCTPSASSVANLNPLLVEPSCRAGRSAASDTLGYDPASTSLGARFKGTVDLFKNTRVGGSSRNGDRVKLCRAEQFAPKILQFLTLLAAGLTPCLEREVSIERRRRRPQRVDLQSAFQSEPNARAGRPVCADINASGSARTVTAHGLWRWPVRSRQRSSQASPRCAGLGC